MITYVVCDLFESPARVLVNTVNTVGVMGKGIAKQFKQIYPDMFKEYQQICESRSFDIGNLWLYKTENRWILNFPTKRHWRQPSDVDYIERGLQKFVEVYYIYGITSVSFPQLGCGNGELDWHTQVQPLMEDYLSRLPIEVFIHLPNQSNALLPEHRDTRATQEWLRGEPGALPFAEVWDDIQSFTTSQLKFEKLNGDESFEIISSVVNEGLIVSEGPTTELISYQGILNLWQQIRQSGFVSVDQLSCGLSAQSEYVLPIMAQLPYIEPVVMADSYDDISLDNIGLRLFLRRQQMQMPLFTDVIG